MAQRRNVHLIPFIIVEAVAGGLRCAWDTPEELLLLTLDLLDWIDVLKAPRDFWRHLARPCSSLPRWSVGHQRKMMRNAGGLSGGSAWQVSGECSLLLYTGVDSAPDAK